MPIKPILVSLTILLSSLTAYGQSPSDFAETASELILDKKYNKLHSQFSTKIKLFFPKKKFRKMWKELETNNGTLESIGEIKSTQKEDLTVSTLPLNFEKIGLNLLLTTTPKGKIVGINFLPLSYEVPSWAKNKVYGKERLTVKTDSFELDGELILPNNCVKCPVVILVHGSGPSDMDGSFAANKLYLDLAYGLANNGIATIRYHKRSYVYGKSLSKLDSMTIYHETIQDAVSAVQLAKEYSFLDSSSIFVLGHSLGAYASPLIAKEDDDIAGIVVLGGPARPLYQIIPEQYEYLFQLDSVLSKQESKKLYLAIEEGKLIEGKESEVEDLKELGNNKMMYYHRMMLSYNPAETIKELNRPALIIQGDRDYQVRHETEFAAYKKALNDNPLVTLALIKGGNHLMVYGDQPSVPTEYYKQEHIDLKALKVIADWIKEN